MIKTTCNRDCPDACGMLATVEGGRITRLQGDPDHPVTKGFLCYRTNQFLKRQYHPERLIEPMFRQGKGFTAISWDAALDMIADKMVRIREQSGAAAIFNYRCGGSLGVMKHLTDYFFERFGPVAIKRGDICNGAGEHAQLLDFGVSDSNDLFDLLNSRTIVLWGKNPHTSNVHLVPLLREAQAKGVRVVLIDPVQHRAADDCDVYLQPRAGGDSAIALGVLRCLFEAGHTDPDAASYCDNLDELRQLCFSKTIDDWADMAGLSRTQIEQLAGMYADGPSAILVGWGMQRRTQGSAAVRTIDALAAVSGNLGIRGGGVSFYFQRRAAFDLGFVRGLTVAPRSISEPLLGRRLLEASDPEYRMVWISNANPVAMLPDSERTARALKSREFTVVVDQFMTDSAQCADLVLPTTTMLEDNDLVGAYGHHYLGNMTPVVDPPPGVKTDYQIVQQLARRVGLEDEFSNTVDEWKRKFLKPVADSGVSLDALAAGPLKNPLSSEILFADREFPTPSGKVNLIHEFDLRPALTTTERPLLLAANSTRKAQSSQWLSDDQIGPATVTVHPDAAGGFEHGQTVLLESELASMQVVLRLDDRQHRQLALMDKGGWLARGRCANSLVPAVLTDGGEGGVLYDTPVRLLPDPEGARDANS
jgi:anaerobic selenocysteine-containing dehydrogenase